MKKLFLVKIAGLLLMAMSLYACKHQSDVQGEIETADTLSVSTPQEAIAKLMAGNARYVSEESIYPRSGMERVEETAPHQAPFAPPDRTSPTLGRALI